MGLPVVSDLSELQTPHVLIITNTEQPQQAFDEAVRVFPRDQVLTIPILGINRERGEKSFDNRSYTGNIK